MISCCRVWRTVSRRMDKNNYMAVFVTLVVCLLVLFSLFSVESRAIDSSKPAGQYNIKMVLKAKSNTSDFWKTAAQGALVAAKEYGVNCDVTGPDQEGDVDKQISLLEEAVRQKPDAVILAAADYEKLAPVCKKAIDEGIRMIMIDSDVDLKQTSGLVATNNVDVGRKLAQEVDKLIGPNEKFGVVSFVKSSSTALDREKGLKENTVNARDRIVQVDYCNGSVQLARDQTVKMLRAHPEIRCMVGLNEYSALGVAYAVRDLHLEGKVKIVNCDSSVELIQRMEEGEIQAFVIQNPFNMGYISVKNAVSIIQKKDIPTFYDTKSVVVTRKTLYTTENQKLLFPFTDADQANSSLRGASE